VADSPDAPTGGPETAPVTLPPAPAPRPRGFTIGARLWLVGVVVLTLPIGLAGQWALALVVMAVGYIGFGIVFNLRRPWWGDAGRAAAAREAPTPPRVVAKLVAMLVLVTVVVWVLFFLTR